MSDTRIVIHIVGVESLEIAVSLLAAADARRIGRSRQFAVDGPTITTTQAEAIHRLADEEGVSVTPGDIPEWWRITAEYQEIPEMSFNEADAWWSASYKNPAAKL
ncbi:hypothetical protein [Streptosporangium sp. NPDC051022]|uniref:hypothetical protein n=1 Tax=Streptosporangium sp. NPDC051022 TaxID=3155752 RepID=UPI00343F1D42